MPCGERSTSARIGCRWLPRGIVGTTQRWSARSSRTTWRHSEPSMTNPCNRTTIGPLPPVSSYSIIPADSSISCMLSPLFSSFFRPDRILRQRQSFVQRACVRPSVTNGEKRVAVDLLLLAIPLCKLNSCQAERIRQQYRSESYPLSSTNGLGWLYRRRFPESCQHCVSQPDHT